MFALFSTLELVFTAGATAVLFAGVVVTWVFEVADVSASSVVVTETAGVVVAFLVLLTYTALPAPTASRAIMARMIRGAIPRFVGIILS